MARRPGRKPTKNLWIFCEGKTEKSYFDKLRFEERVGKLRPKKSGRQDAIGIVQDAVDFMGKGDYEKGDTVVCVFDKDKNSDEQMDQAARLARKHGIDLVHSIPCFEYWVLCHFGYHPAPYDCQSVRAKVEEMMPNYAKGDSPLYSQLKDKQREAMKYAKKIHAEHVKEEHNLLHDESNPLTLLYLLVKMARGFS